MCVCVCVCVRARTCAHVCVCVHMHMCMCIFACLFVFMLRNISITQHSVSIIKRTLDWRRKSVTVTFKTKRQEHSA